MREILFRAKSVWGNWCEGYLVKMPNYFRMSTRDDLLSFGVDAKTIGQYTGLTDKNGKKIFEGDILTLARKMDGMGTYYVTTLAFPVNVEVKWDFCGWMWETLCEDKRYIHFPDAWCHFECEVIGNIHDNPELLRMADHELR